MFAGFTSTVNGGNGAGVSAPGQASAGLGGGGGVFGGAGAGGGFGVFAGGGAAGATSSSGTGMFSGGTGTTSMFSGGVSVGAGTATTGLFSGGTSYTTPATTSGIFNTGGFQGGTGVSTSIGTSANPSTGMFGSSTGTASFNYSSQGLGGQQTQVTSSQAARALSNQQTQEMESHILAAVSKALEGIMGTNQNSDDDEDPEEKEELDKLPNSVAEEIRAKRKDTKKQENRDRKQLVISGLEDKRRDAILSAVKQAVAHGVIVVQPEMDDSTKLKVSDQKDKEQADKPENPNRDQKFCSSRNPPSTKPNFMVGIWKELLADLVDKAKDAVNPLKELDEYQKHQLALKWVKEKKSTVHLDKLWDEESQSTALSETDTVGNKPSKQTIQIIQHPANTIPDEPDDWRSLLKQKFQIHRNIPIWIDYSGKICAKIVIPKKRAQEFANFEDLKADLLTSELSFLKSLPQFASAYFWRRDFEDGLPQWYRLPLITPINLDEMVSGDTVLRIESQDKNADILHKHKLKCKKPESKSDNKEPFKVSPLLLTGEMKMFSRQQIKENEKLVIDPPIELLRLLLAHKQQESAKDHKIKLPDNGCPTYKMGYLYDLEISVSHLVLKNIWGRVEYKKILHLKEADLESLPNSVLLSGTGILVTDPLYQSLNPHITQVARWNSVPSWYTPPTHPKPHQDPTSHRETSPTALAKHLGSSAHESQFPPETPSRQTHSIWSRAPPPTTGMTTPNKSRQLETADTHFRTPERPAELAKSGLWGTPSTAQPSRRLESPGIEF